MSADVRILSFESRHAEAWARLTEGWILEAGFALEPRDRQVIADPEGAILAAGGRIFMAEREGRAVGCCALIPMSDGGFEVAKMTTAPEARGLGLGRRLLETCEAEARAAGGRRLYLETNSGLAPAMGLYRAFGFTDLPAVTSPYARVDVVMEKPLV